ncbi:hypothetical protein HZA97_08370 [Candidatus Woesearchaeota archaeon]|nr:hypothetical protein [Candidatus Woesearchaeota archaeon]
MKQIFLSFPGKISASIESNADLKINNLLLRAYLPGVEITSSKKTHFKIKHVESLRKKIFQENNQIIIFDSWKGKLSLDIYHLLYNLVRVKLMEKKLFCVHAACVGNYLIVGHTGTGKTTISLELVKKGLKLFSGNKTIVLLGKQISAIAGTKTITTKQDFGNALKYGNRCAFLLKENQYDQSKKANIKAIILVRLNDGVKEFDEMNRLSALHNLYPYFMDAVNADTIIQDKVFVGTPPKGIQELLARKLSKTLKKIPVYSITGPKSFIVNKITQL